MELRIEQVGALRALLNAREHKDVEAVAILKTKVNELKAESDRFKFLNDDLVKKLKITLSEIEKPAVKPKHALRVDITKAKMISSLHEQSARSFLDLLTISTALRKAYVPGMTLGIVKPVSDETKIEKKQS